jgi:hypothetical protein
MVLTLVLLLALFDPRAVVEAAVSVAPADPSEGDKLNLTINIASVSATKSLSVYLAFR